MSPNYERHEMLTTCTREQMAAILVEGESRYPGPELTINGNPGDWAVAIIDYNSSAHAAWLSSERKQTVCRTFKTLDAAHTAAVSIYRLAFPQDDRIVSVAVKTIQQR